MVAFDDVAPSSPVASTHDRLRISQMKSVASATGWKLSASAATTSTTIIKQIMTLQLPPVETTAPVAKQASEATTNTACRSRSNRSTDELVGQCKSTRYSKRQSRGPSGGVRRYIVSIDGGSRSVRDCFRGSSQPTPDHCRSEQYCRTSAVPEPLLPPPRGPNCWRASIPKKPFRRDLAHGCRRGRLRMSSRPCAPDPYFPRPCIPLLPICHPSGCCPGYPAFRWTAQLCSRPIRNLSSWRQFPVNLQQTYFQYFWGATDTESRRFAHSIRAPISGQCHRSLDR